MKLRSRVAYAILPKQVWDALRQEWPMAKLRWNNTWSRRRIQKRFHNVHQLKIHLGCGKRVTPGWLNVDCFAAPGIDLVWDLRVPLPFADECASFIYHEHVLEHVSKEDAGQLLQECHRVLATDGVLRIGVPDAEIYVRAYMAGDRNFFKSLDHLGNTVEPLETPMEVINQAFRMDGHHRFAWDWPTLQLALTKAGFKSTCKFASGEASSKELCLDDPSHAFETLYAEARK